MLKIRNIRWINQLPRGKNHVFQQGASSGRLGVAATPGALLRAATMKEDRHEHV
jgi:hypothetical protein